MFEILSWQYLRDVDINKRVRHWCMMHTG